MFITFRTVELGKITFWAHIFNFKNLELKEKCSERIPFLFFSNLIYIFVISDMNINYMTLINTWVKAIF